MDARQGLQGPERGQHCLVGLANRWRRGIRFQVYRYDLEWLPLG
jgi:hypothetical protein